MPKSSAPSQKSDAAYLRAFPAKIGKGDRTKLRMLREAIRCISEEGLSALNHESLATRLGIFRSQVTYHFPLLEDLLSAALLYISNVAQELLVEELAAARTPAERLDALVDATFRWAKRHPEQVRARVACHEAFMISPALRAFHTEIVETAQQRIASVLAEIPSVPARDRGMLAVALHAVISSALIHRVTTDSGQTVEAAGQAVRRSYRAMIPLK